MVGTDISRRTCFKMTGCPVSVTMPRHMALQNGRGNRMSGDIGHDGELQRMTQERHQDPLHGITLAMMLERLVEHVGWEEMGRLIPIRCFTHDPSVKSSLTFLRKTPWARARVEAMYLDRLDEIAP
jgi:hypothetical protein